MDYIPTLLSKLKKYFIDLIFPIFCIHCRCPGKILCDDCLKTIKPLRVQFCPLCEKTVVLNGEVCRPCRQRFRPAIDNLLVASDYKNKLLAKSIHFLKYKFVRDLASPLAQVMIISLNKFKLPAPDFILPISLHPRRLRWRGFNQAELLAQEVSVGLLPGLTIPVVNNLVVRQRYTPPQKDIKNYKDRQENLKNAFQINSNFDWKSNNLSRQNLVGKNILIIDDITTTGATILNFAKELKKLHPKSISAVVLGRQS